MIRNLYTVSGYLISVLGLVMLTGCSDPADYEGLKEPNHQSDNHPAIPVEQSRIPRLFISPGSVIASRELMVSSTTSGFIQKIAVEEGDHVDVGTLLVRIDPSKVKRAISQAEASVAAAQAELKDADDDVRKFRRLAASKSISDDRLRKGVLRRENVRADLRKAQAELHAQQAELEYIEITSPVSGQVVKRFMSAGDISTPGNPILYLESLQGMKFETYVPEKFLVQLKTSGKVMVEVDTLRKRLKERLLQLFSQQIRSHEVVKSKSCYLTPLRLSRECLAERFLRLVSILS